MTWKIIHFTLRELAGVALVVTFGVLGMMTAIAEAEAAGLGAPLRQTQGWPGPEPGIMFGTAAQGPYDYRANATTIIAAQDTNHRWGLWSTRDSLTCSASATLTVNQGDHQLALLPCATDPRYTSEYTITPSGQSPSSHDLYGYASASDLSVQGTVSTARYYDGQAEWTPLGQGLVQGDTRVTFQLSPPGGTWQVWVPSAVASWGECGDTQREAAADATQPWPEHIESGGSLSLSGCAHSDVLQVQARPVIPGASTSAAPVAEAWLQAAPAARIDPVAISQQANVPISVLVFLSPLVIVPMVWRATRSPMIAGAVGVVGIIAIVLGLGLSPYLYLSILLAVAGAAIIGYFLRG